MTWARYDDELPFNRKVAWLRAHGESGIAALGLHLLANTWSRHEGMQGFLPAYMPEQLTGRYGAKLARLLVDCGMFVACDEGWMINDYESYGDRDDGTPTVERVARLSKVRAEAGRAGGLAKAAKRGSKPPSKTGSKPVAVAQQSSTPVPVPVPNDVDGSKSGQRTETLDPADARCTAHQGVADPGPCRGCMTARESAQRALDRARLAVVDERRDCPLCDDDGFVLDEADGHPIARCDHQQRRTG